MVAKHMEDLMLQVLSQPKLEQTFGRFRWWPNGESAITIDPTWAAKNIVTVHIPELVGVSTGLGPCSGNVQWHKAGAEQLKRLFRDLRERRLLHHIKHWGGSFVPRRMRGSRSLSRHSWAIAFDINVPGNQLGNTPAAAGSHWSVRELVEVAERHGFAWGGNFPFPRQDGMHFELCKIVRYTDVYLELNGKIANVQIELRDNVAWASLVQLARVSGDTTVRRDARVQVGQYLQGRGYSLEWDADKKHIVATK
jgi:hypothetical protein